VLRLRYLVALGAICIAALASNATSYNRYQQLDDVASWLAGRPVTVRCFTAYESSKDPTISFWGASAYVEIEVDPETKQPIRPKDFTVVAHPICDDIWASSGVPTKDFAWAVLVIVHESGHLRGAQFPLWYDEGLVNCWALRRSVAVAQLKFGLLPENVPLFRKLVYKEFLSQPDHYNISGCTPR